MTPKIHKPASVVFTTAFLLLALSDCAPLRPLGSDASAIPTLPAKLTGAGPSTLGDAIIGGTRRTKPLIEPGPAPPAPGNTTVERLSPPPAIKGQIDSLSIEEMPLPAFINTVLGDTLHLNFQVDTPVATRNDLVTLRIGGPRSAQDLLAITTGVLRSYGLQLAYEGEVVRVRQNEALKSEMPRIIWGRATPEVASASRPIFQMVPLGQVGAQDMASWITTAYAQKITIVPSAVNNSIMLLGLPDDVRAAMDGIRLLDQPRLAGRRSLKIEPVFWSAAGFAERLIEVLKAEGYNASSTVQPPAAITILPVSRANTILVFTADQAALDHVARWVRDLDRPAKVDQGQSVFYYAVRNTTAESLAKVLNEVIAGKGSAQSAGETERSSPLASSPPGRPAPGPSASAPQIGPEAGATPTRTHFVTDVARNAIIYLGSAESYAQIHHLIESLDQAPREVLIEVTVAEVTLSGTNDFGVEGQLSTTLPDVKRAILGTIAGGLGIATAGFNVNVVNSANSPRVILNALQSAGNTKVLSTPRLLARSGATAKIQVGSDIPIVTSQGTSAQLVTNATSDILQQIQYRSIGVILHVKPVIYAGNQVDLDITQEVSSVASTTTGGIQSPTINNRNVETQLSLNDGATVVLGGLIQDTKDETSSGLPYLEDIPNIGSLFKVQHHDETKTELLVFITPYIISSSRDSDRITDSFRGKMGLWPEPSTDIRW
jgi:general secretion pathway protein D